MEIDQILPAKRRALNTRDTEGLKDSAHIFTERGNRMTMLSKDLIDALPHFEHLEALFHFS